MSRATAAELAAVPLFAALDAAVLEDLASRLTVRELERDAVVFREGSSSHEILVVLGGSVELARPSEGEAPIVVGTRGPGEWFGEVGLIGVKPRSVEARARTAARILVVPARELLDLYRRDVRAYALLTMNLARELARKLDAMERRWLEGQASHSS